MFFVLAGAVDVVKSSAEGEKRQDVVLARLGVGDFFGEMSLLLAEPRSATVRAAANGTRVLRISPGNFDTIVKLQPQVAITMLRALAQRLRLTSRLAVR
jgi:CRP-like cAMP-binding protein